MHPSPPPRLRLLSLLLGVLLLPAASSAEPPPGYKEAKSAAGCVLYKGPVESDGVEPMRAVCHWPDVAPETANKALAVWADHDKYFTTLAESTTRRTEGARTLVFQVHRAKGIKDREVLLWMEMTPVADGGKRYSWTTKDTGPLEVSDGRVRVGRDDGYWEVRPHPEGGSAVIYQLSYNAGGNVPAVMVRWFQTSGIVDVLEELRAYLANK